MTLIRKTQSLRQKLRQWAAAPEWRLLVRYELLPQKPSPVRHKRWTQKTGRLLRVLGLSRGRYRGQIWHSGLKHAARSDGRTLLLWSDLSDRQSARDACLAIQRLLSDHPGFLPVLVTEQADFAFYSRLGWLVEYTPDLPGEGASYRARKQQYLAWRYRDATAIPLSAGLADAEAFFALLQREG